MQIKMGTHFDEIGVVWAGKSKQVFYFDNVFGKCKYPIVD
jgi:hypothetical protein